MTPLISHETILASAGSGKTYQLSNRIIRILASGAQPASIVALTFTRKAAGEFSRRVLTKLADAAMNDTAAKKLASELRLENWDAARFCALLNDTVRQLHRLRFSTLDSFYQTLVRSFLFEFGISGSFMLLDENLAQDAQERVLREIFQRDTGGKFSEQKDFLEAFRQATFGKEENITAHLFSDFFQKALQIFQEIPDENAWGDAARLWHEKPCEWLPVPFPDDFQNAISLVETYADMTGFRDRRFGEALKKFLRLARGWQLGMPIGTHELGFFEDKIFSEFWKTGAISYYNKEHSFPKRIGDALRLMTRHIIGCALVQKLQITAGVFKILKKYDDIYEHSIRKKGLLTFADTARLLANSEAKFDISFRLDAEIKHWLFDEFQDTSRHDWRVVANNLDEILRDNTGIRSAFFVGDIKQALYDWRGGDYTLLTSIREKYDLPTRSLDTTYRSSPDVLELTNSVFENIGNLSVSLPEFVKRKWAQNWRTHKAAGAAEMRAGHAAWYVCGRGKNDTSGDAGRRLKLLGELLKKQNPLEKKLTCGILVQKNSEALHAASFLRTQGFRVISETDAQIASDNPLIPPFLALFEFAAHPRNGFAKGIIKMTPALENILENKNWRAEFLASVVANGFAATLENAGKKLAVPLPEDAFSRLRWAQLLSLAREFDDTESREIDAFVRFVRNVKRREKSDENSIQVMTIHKAKGLEFDVVYLPFLEGRRLDVVRDDAFIYSLENGVETAWVLDSPTKLICEMTPPLDMNLRLRQRAACYENLCKLYVALTRAKFETVILTTKTPEKKAKKSSGGLDENADANFPQLLTEVLKNDGGDDFKKMPAVSFPEIGFDVELAWEAGSTAWFEKVIVKNDTAEKADSRKKVSFEKFVARQFLKRQRPSEDGDSFVKNISPENDTGREIGICVHALLAEVPFLTAENLAEILAKIDAKSVALRRDFPDWVCVSAAQKARVCIENKRFAGVFEKNSDDAILWRERTFSVILDGVLVNGIFDRVVLENGTARIFDFKTDVADGAILKSRYGAQMNAYRRALAKLTRLSASAISATLVHIGSGEQLTIQDAAADF